jgi:3-dehydroquinate synthase
VPTTVLGQNDAGVGVKNGVQFHGRQKRPRHVRAGRSRCSTISSSSLTLPARDWLCGVAEAWKVAIIRDSAFLRLAVRQRAQKFPARDATAMEQLVYRCADEHLAHIRTNGEPVRITAAPVHSISGTGAPTSWNSCPASRISHGEAVAFGVLLDSRYAREKGWLSAEEFDAIERGHARKSVSRFGTRRRSRAMHPASWRSSPASATSRSISGGELCVTYPRGIGARFEAHEIDLPLMERCLRELQP